MKTLFQSCAILACLLAITNAAFGARVSVEPQNAAVYAGQSLTLQYRLTQAAQPADPPLLAIDGCEVRYAGMMQSSETHIVNNRRSTTSSYIYSYKVQPRGAGVFRVPSLVFEIPGGTQAAAPETTIITAEAPTSSEFLLQIETDADEVYVGQPVQLTWVWLTAQRVSQVEITWPAPDGAEVFVGPRSQPDRNRGAAVASIMGKDVSLRSESRSFGGRAWTAYVAEMIVVPTHSGVLEIPGSTVLIDADTGRRQRGVSIFDSRTITETVSAKAPARSLTVRNLPESGRPANFSGLVGRYRLEAVASPTNVRVGDPIELTVVVYGPEATAREPEIDFGTIPGFSGVFRIDTTGDDDARVQGGKLLKRTLRAQRDDVSSIPPIELTYFDPELGRYAVARTSSIPLEVTPTRIVTLADARGERDSEPTGAQIESRDGGLQANVTDTSALRTENTDTLALLKTPEKLALLTAPPALFVIAGAAVFVRTRRARREGARNSKRALPDALVHLDKASTPNEVAATIRSFIGVRFPDAGSAITGEDARRLLDPAGPTANDLADILNACDAARFGGVGAEIESLRQRAREALSNLERGEIR